MTEAPRQLTLEEWDRRYEQLDQAGLIQPRYGGRLSRHLHDGDYRLAKLRYDNSPAALRLWNFLLTEEDRLREARECGKRVVGTMKDLGTVPVIAYSFSNLVAFYPDGAWWIPCVMELSAGLLEIADSLGIDESFCPVRAMLGAFVTRCHFPVPDLLVCSAGAVCDDFSAIAQRLEDLGHRILWWEVPHRPVPEPNEVSVLLPGGLPAPERQVDLVKSELLRVKEALEALAGTSLDETALHAGIKKANEIRRCLAELRRLVYTAQCCPMPALEMLIAEMLAIHYCSDRDECLRVLEALLSEVRRRIASGVGVLGADAARVFWVNPVADLRAMNLLEACGGRICGTEYLFTHALDAIPQDRPPMEALAATALADPMAGSSRQRAERICRDIGEFGAEAVVVSRIPGASHCALEGWTIQEVVRSKMDIPILEIEVPPVADAAGPGLRTRLEALVETVKRRRRT
ncbi:MAG: 2-hydroxyacyl-CoA dehydratase [Sedimentisphaerales bacterium]|nr:2-hydroxyacyl-CoA dehydratase [Sedimentisphaerales bacterium]